jgi:hypothetical protein
VVLVADGGDSVAAHIATLDSTAARSIGRAARTRVLAEHTYAQRVLQLEAVLADCVAA